MESKYRSLKKNKLTDIENRLVVARGGEGEGGRLFLFSFFKFKYIEFFKKNQNGNYLWNIVLERGRKEATGLQEMFYILF